MWLIAWDHTITSYSIPTRVTSILQIRYTHWRTEGGGGGGGGGGGLGGYAHDSFFGVDSVHDVT